MLRLLYRKILRPIVTSHDSLEAVAGGVAIGVFVAITPTVGIQMPIAWLVATLCGANRVVAVALVWISNPVTVLPMYYGEYVFGSWLLGRPPATSYNDFAALWGAMAEMGYLERLRNLSDRIALPLLAGSFPPALLLGAAAYPLALWRLRCRRQRAAQRAAEPQHAAGHAQGICPPGPQATRGLRGSPPVSRVSGVVLLLALAFAALPACRDGRGPLTQEGVPEESSTTGVLDLWYGHLADGTLLILAPYHAEARRNDLADQRYDQVLGLGETPHGYSLLRIYRFDPEAGELSMGADGIPITAEASSGRITSLRPSELLGNGTETTQRAVMASVLGAGPLPALRGRQTFQLLVVLPTAEPLAALEGVCATVGEVEVPLSHAQIRAADFESFLAAPSAGAFKRALDAVLEGSLASNAEPAAGEPADDS